MAKAIIYSGDTRAAILRGVNKLADAVKVTLGPEELKVIKRNFRSPTITKDGMTVAKVELGDPLEKGAQIVGEVASKTSDIAGHGTTTAALLAQATHGEDSKKVTAGTNPVEEIDQFSKAVESKDLAYVGRPADEKEIPRPALDGFGRTEREDDKELLQDTQPERAVVSEEEPQREELPLPPLDDLRHLLQTRFPVLYAQVLEPTLADLRQEHSAALAEGHPSKARWILLQGYGALATAAVCQLGSSLLGRIAALWQARSPK